MKKILTKKNIKEWSLVTFGNLLVAISFSFFLDPLNIVIGGSTGLSTILKYLFSIDTAISVFVINFVLLIVGLVFLGKDFFIKTLYSTFILPIFISLCNFIYGLLTKDGQLLVSDQLLCILFSSLIMGLGIGIVMRKGGTTGGTEVPQQMMYKYLHIPFSISLFLIDGVIVFLGAFFIKDSTQVINFTMILYAAIFIYLSGFVMDQIIFSGFNSRAVYIISEKNDEIKKRILEDFDRGVTQIRVVGGYTNQDRSQLVCILSSGEFYKLKSIINELDSKAFFYVVRANEVSGEGFTHHVTN